MKFLKPTKFKIVFALIMTIFFPLSIVIFGLSIPFGTNSILDGITSFFSSPSFLLIFSDGIIFGLLLFLGQFFVYYLFACSLYKASWKRILFGVYLLYIVLLTYCSSMGEVTTSLSILDTIITSISLLGLLLFVYNKEFLSAFWKIWFPVFIVWDIAFNVFLNPAMNHTTFEISTLWGILLFLPLYVGLFLYTYKFKKENYEMTGDQLLTENIVAKKPIFTKKIKLIITAVIVAVLIFLGFFIINKMNPDYSKMTKEQLCDQLSSDSIRCKAIVTQDFNVCKNISNDLGERSSCCASVALLKNDNSFCSECMGTNSIESNRYCVAYGSVSKQQIDDIRNGKKASTDETNNATSSENLYISFGLGGNTNNIKCSTVLADKECYGSCVIYKDQCASMVAANKNDPSICDLSDYKDLCLRTYASIYKNDVSLCSLISPFASGMREMCVESVVTNGEDTIGSILFPHGVQ